MRELTNLYVERTKRRWLIGCISTLVSLPLMCCCLILLPTVVFPALDNVAATGNENTTLFVMLGVGLVALIGLLGVPVVIALVLINRNTRSLDAIFTPLGLTGSAYMLYGRHYQGQLAGREVDVYIYRGPTVEFRLKTNVQTRAQFYLRDSIPVNVAKVLNKQPLEAAAPGLEGYAVYPLDETWTRNLLVDPLAVEAIQKLMTLGAGWAIFRRVEIQPGEVLLHLDRSRQMFSSPLDSVAVQTWLTALESLALAVESQPAPAVAAEPFLAATRQSRQSLNKFLLYAVLFIVFVMPLCFIAIGVIAYLFAVMSG
jgi:hypothetical protein